MTDYIESFKRAYSYGNTAGFGRVRYWIPIELIREHFPWVEDYYKELGRCANAKLTEPSQHFHAGERLNEEMRRHPVIARAQELWYVGQIHKARNA